MRSSPSSVKNSFCGICGTDLHEYLHGPIQIPQKPHPFSKAVLPLILGHEFSGVVLETGDEVQNVRAGDRVSIQPNVARFAAFEDQLTKYWSKRGISFKRSLKIILMRGSVQGIV